MYQLSKVEQTALMDAFRDGLSFDQAYDNLRNPVPGPINTLEDVGMLGDWCNREAARIQAMESFWNVMLYMTTLKGSLG